MFQLPGLGQGTHGCAGVDRLPAPAQDQRRHLWSSARIMTMRNMTEKQPRGRSLTGVLRPLRPHMSCKHSQGLSSPGCKVPFKAGNRSSQPDLDIRSSLGVGRGVPGSHTATPASWEEGYMYRAARHGTPRSKSGRGRAPPSNTGDKGHGWQGTVPRGSPSTGRHARGCPPVIPCPTVSSPRTQRQRTQTQP